MNETKIHTPHDNAGGEDANALDNLIRLLDLEQIEVNIFRGINNPDKQDRVYGGQVAAQAMVAAGRTVSHGRIHSIHSYFLLPGDPAVPILYEVDRIRDGHSFTTRRVVAIQHGKAIFNLQASFHADEPTIIEHHMDMPNVPPPEELQSLHERLGSAKIQVSDWLSRPLPVEHRHVTPLPWFKTEARDAVQYVWIKADGELPEDNLLHSCVIAYASDLSLISTMLLPHVVDWSKMMLASIDHCMWFHRPFKADDWLLYAMDSPNEYGSRGLARGSIFTRDGDLVVSVTQEGLTRYVG